MNDQIASEYVEIRIRLSDPVQKLIVAALLGFRMPEKYFHISNRSFFVTINCYYHTMLIGNLNFNWLIAYRQFSMSRHLQ